MYRSLRCITKISPTVAFLRVVQVKCVRCHIENILPSGSHQPIDSAHACHRPSNDKPSFTVHCLTFSHAHAHAQPETTANRRQQQPAINGWWQFHPRENEKRERKFKGRRRRRKPHRRWRRQQQRRKSRRREHPEVRRQSPRESQVQDIAQERNGVSWIVHEQWLRGACELLFLLSSSSPSPSPSPSPLLIFLLLPRSSTPRRALNRLSF
jgi:hypothetical protein